MKLSILSCILLLRIVNVVSQPLSFPINTNNQKAGPQYFNQEYHEPYPVGKTTEENDVRAITVDGNTNVWIATAAGLFMKGNTDSIWVELLETTDKGPAYAVVTHDNAIWMGTWKGVYRYKDNHLEYMQGTEGPISVLCPSKEGLYALGPGGVWLFDGLLTHKKNYPVARSVRNAISDNNKGLWITTDVGLYHSNSQRTKHLHKKEHLISASVKDVAWDSQGKLWVAGLGGISIFQNGVTNKFITTAQGCPSIFVTRVKKSPDNIMWVGTKVGIVRYNPDGSVGSSRVDLQACKLEYSIVSPK